MFFICELSLRLIAYGLSFATLLRAGWGLWGSPSFRFRASGTSAQGHQPAGQDPVAALAQTRNPFAPSPPHVSSQASHRPSRPGRQMKSRLHIRVQTGQRLQGVGCSGVTPLRGGGGGTREGIKRIRPGPRRIALLLPEAPLQLGTSAITATVLTQ